MPRKALRLAILLGLGLGMGFAVPARAAGIQDMLFGLFKKGIHRQKAPPPDSLPPNWQAAPEQALQDSLIGPSLPDLGPRYTRLKISNDPRQLHVTVDPDSGTLSYGVLAGEVPVTPSAQIPLGRYASGLTQLNYQRLWGQAARERLNQQAAGVTPRHTSGLSIPLPFEMPKRVQSLLGPGGPAINVSGSERISLSGTSDWSNRPLVLGQSRSLFPSLDMRQDLDIHLEGQLSDRVRVNLLQSSTAQIPLANRIAINYTGQEEDVLQALNLGNTNLSLPGTQFVSYSGRNEGLFGAKTALRYGPVDFTVLASKQEGRSERASYTGGSTHEDIAIADFDYVRGTYFFLEYPDLGGREIADNTIRVFVDDGIGGNNPNSRHGIAYIDPTTSDTTSYRGDFDELVRFTDFDILQPYGPFHKVVRLQRSLGDRQVLAVMYRDSTRQVTVGFATDSLVVMKLIKTSADLLTADPTTGFFDTSSPLNRTRELELRNFYNLGSTRIDPNSLKLQIRRGTDEPPAYFYFPPGNPNAIPYLQIMGLDNLDETTTPKPGHDGQVDRGLITNDPNVQRSGALVDYDNGILFFPDLRPFAPRIKAANAPDTSAFEEAIDRVLNRDAHLTWGSDTLSNSANRRIYDLRSPNRYYDARYYITGELSASGIRSTIRLNRTNLVEGSESVSINGEQLVRGRDYDIDYDLGEVRLKRQVGPADRLSVDFTYAPLFATANKTLLGGALSVTGRDRSVGGAFLYESREAQEQRPRLGEEPSRTFIGDLNTDLHFKPLWMTRLADMLPGVRTTDPSTFNFNAEVGYSIPNPNTKNEVYIDDMEGVRDAVSLTMSYDHWRWSSIPPCPTCPGATIQGSMPDAEVHWYSPPNAVKQKELKPALNKGEGSENSVQVLAISVPRRPITQNSPTDPTWVGLTYPLDATGYDLTGAQFIELWVNDFRDFTRVRDRQLKINIDIGRVSEDQMRAPDQPPNGILDSEDFNRDGQLNEGEDVGLDMTKNAAETKILDLSTASSADPSGDNWAGPIASIKNELDARRWRFVNGTEGNSQATASPFPDTEDLDGNNILDRTEAFVRYTVNLGEGQSPFLVTDVYKDYSNKGTIPPENVPALNNGWRLYRIPLADTSRFAFGSPDLKFTKQVRVWVEGIVDTDFTTPDYEQPLLVLGGLDVVGSRWLAAGLDSIARVANTSLTLTSVNTQDNADIYTPPFDPGTTVSGNQSVKRREQSLALQFDRLAPGGDVETYRSSTLDEDYSRYRSLRWYVTGVGDSSNGLQYFMRFGTDSTNYYELRSLLPPIPIGGTINWRQVELVLTDISNLKLLPDYQPGQTYIAPGKAPGDTFVLVGRPSFTRLRRITFGVRNLTSSTIPHSQVWLDEIRAHDVIKDPGIAHRIIANGRMANLLGYSFSWSGSDEDFLSLGQQRGSGNATSIYNGSLNLDLHRFIQGTGLQLPVNLGYSRGAQHPRYTAGDDIRRTGLIQEQSSTLAETRTAGINVSRAWSERSSPFLRYTLGGLTGNYQWRLDDHSSPTTVDTTRWSSMNVNYDTQPRQLWTVPLPFSKTARFYPLPEHLFWKYSVLNNENHTYARDPARGLVPQNFTQGRAAQIDYGMDVRPFDFLHHHFDATRNLSLAPPLMERVGFVNLGRNVRWSQSIDATFRFQRGNWIRPVLGWNGNYGQNNGPELSPDLSLRSVGNGQAVTLTWEIPLDQLRRGGGVPVAADTTKHKGGIDWPGQTVGRIGTIAADFRYGRHSGYSRLVGSPSLAYMLGLTTNPGFGYRVLDVFGDVSSINTDWHAGFNHRMMLFYGIVAQSRFDYNGREDQANGARSRRNDMRFPDFDVTYGQLPHAVGIDRVFRDAQLHTAWQLSRQNEFATGDRLTSRAVSSDFRPLISFSGTLKNNTRAELKVERRVTQRENMLFGQSVTNDRVANVNLNLTRTYESGQRMNLFGKQSVVKGTVTMGLSGTYTRRGGETLTPGIPGPQQVIAQDQLSVQGNTSYSFSTNLNGGATLGFGQNRDLRISSHPVVNRSVRLELTATFTF